MGLSTPNTAISTPLIKKNAINTSLTQRRKGFQLCGKNKTGVLCS